MGKDWNKAYDIGETPWDKGYASPALNAFLGSYPLTGSVLVPGCDTGHDVRLLAAQGAEVVGMDIAPNAIRKAKAFLPTGKECYELGDFLQFDSSHCGVYDWVVELRIGVADLASGHEAFEALRETRLRAMVLRQRRHQLRVLSNERGVDDLV